MNTGPIVITSFFAGIILTIIGAYFKVTHTGDGETWLIVSFISWAIFVIASIYEVASSRTIGRSEKLLWTFGLILLSGVTGIVYLLVGRKRIVATASRAV